MKKRLLALFTVLLIAFSNNAMMADAYLIDQPADSLFSTSEQYPDFTTETGSDLKNTQVDEIYRLYDALVAAYPGYARKELLGNEASEEGLPVYLYTFEPLRPASSVKTLFPAIFLTCGVHGEEKAPAIVSYLLMKHLCEDWQNQSLLETIRHNVKFLIIPAANPYGWNHNQRRNANNVDINRNFPDGWVLGDPTRSTYGGPAPLSEPESGFIRTVFQDNPDIAMMFDFHNFFRSPERREFIVVYSTNAFTSHVSRNLISSLTRKWRGDFDFFPEDENYFAGRASSGSAGMVAGYAYNTWNIRHSGTFEVCWRLLIDETSTSYNQDMFKAGVETLANFLLISLRELNHMPTR